MKQNEKSLNSLSPEISWTLFDHSISSVDGKEISLFWKRLDLGTESDFVIEVKPMLRFSSAICHSPSLLLRFLKEIYYLLTKNSKYSHLPCTLYQGGNQLEGGEGQENVNPRVKVLTIMTIPWLLWSSSWALIIIYRVIPQPPLHFL